MAIALDNASNNNRCIEILVEKGIINKNQHIRCIAHIMNRAVKDLFKNLVPELKKKRNISNEEDSNNEENSDDEFLLSESNYANSLFKVFFSLKIKFFFFFLS